MASEAANQAVRNYLTALQAPEELRDNDAIADLERKLGSTNDRLERITLKQQIKDAQSPPVERYESEFVTHAKAWADSHSVDVQTLQSEGVPDHVLERAGFQVRSKRRKRSKVGADHVRAAIRQTEGPFRIQDLVDTTGASVGTVRNVVNDQLKAGHIDKAGVDTSHDGPGRAPALYKQA